MASLPEKLRLAVGRSAGARADAPPDWVVLDLHGSYPAHAAAGSLQALLRREESFESLTERLERLAATDWVRGVLVRVGELHAGLATAHAIGSALGRLAADKRVVGYVPQVSMRSLLVTAQLAEVVAPESAEVALPGFAAEQVFLGAFLSRHGITFENLRIREYKSALTRFSADRMDEHEREQLTAYLDGARERGARPVLVTSVERRRFTADGTPRESHGDYPAAMRALAEREGVPLVDLTALSLELWGGLGPEGTKGHFLWWEPGGHPNYPDGVQDNTHFQAHGAIEVARLVAALPRVLHYAEELASSAARMYGRWTRSRAHSAYFAALEPAQRRAYAREFRAAAYRAVVKVLTGPLEAAAVPEYDPGRLPWDQAEAVAGAIAEYGWVDVRDAYIPAEAVRVLDTAVPSAPAPRSPGRGQLVLLGDLRHTRPRPARPVVVISGVRAGSSAAA